MILWRGILALGLSVGLGAQVVNESSLRSHFAFLSDDLLEGRGMGQRGGDLAVAYLETQLKALGLQPGHEGQFRQPIRFIGARALADQSSLRFTGKGLSQSFACGPEILFNTSTGLPEITFDAPLLFVGYGISAPAEGWDDYKGQDVRGKLLVMLVNEPVPTPADPARFAGSSLTYFGRWNYKFEEARRRGAVGALLINAGVQNAYGWNVLQTGHAGERFHLASDAQTAVPFMGWISEGGARDLLSGAGQRLESLLEQAQSKSFVPVPLDLKLEGKLVSQVRMVESANVIGLVPGTDPKLKEEVVIYGAHWDHLGRHEAEGRVEIHNGAVDNASGCAALLAMAAQAVRKPAKRTQMFLFPCGEEAGLLGAYGYVANPAFPLKATVAMLNMDCLNFAGPTSDIGLQGVDRTPLDSVARRVAKQMGLSVRKDPPDSLGLFFRADHFAFVKSGIPAFTLTMVMGAGPTWNFLDPGQRQLAEGYGKSSYHTIRDRFDPTWDLRGMVDQAQFLWTLGRTLANAPGRPTWKSAPSLATPQKGWVP